MTLYKGFHRMRSRYCSSFELALIQACWKMEYGYLK
ncbi:hypothetical protein NC651_035136 [Populus alba x Populus x berolinensis]|nr:hypothetical protein NC651_035136 [Populus alba x Populus x berolinensis]